MVAFKELETGSIHTEALGCHEEERTNDDHWDSGKILMVKKKSMRDKKGIGNKGTDTEVGKCVSVYEEGVQVRMAKTRTVNTCLLYTSRCV